MPASHRSRSTRSSTARGAAGRTVGCPPWWWGSTSRRSPRPGSITTGMTVVFEIAEVAEVQAFPGMRRGSAGHVRRRPPRWKTSASARRAREIWIRGDRAEILARRWTRRGRATRSPRRRRPPSSTPWSFLTVSQTFGFMRSLAVASALLVIGGVAVYFDARRRGRVLGSAFARRMGLTRRQHRRALLAEVLAGVGVGLLAGVARRPGRRRGGARAHRPAPVGQSARPPPTRDRGCSSGSGSPPWSSVGSAAAVTQRVTDRDDPLEVLRGGS